MDERKREGFAPPALGGSSLLVVFAVLALTVFALLSLSTVRADTRLADASAQAVKDYYAADCQAQEILAWFRTGRPWPGMEWEEDRDGRALLRYDVPILDAQELQVEVRVDGDGSYEVLRWQAVPVGDWAPDDNLHVWDGGDLDN